MYFVAMEVAFLFDIDQEWGVRYLLICANNKSTDQSHFFIKMRLSVHRDITRRVINFLSMLPSKIHYLENQLVGNVNLI